MTNQPDSERKLIKDIFILIQESPLYLSEMDRTPALELAKAIMEVLTNAGLLEKEK